MEPWLIRIADYLLAQSWQIAVLTLAVALAAFALRNRSAHVRYLLWLIVLAKALVPPLYSVPLAVLPERAPPVFVPAPPMGERMMAEPEPVSRASRPRIADRMPATRSAPSPVVSVKPARYSTRAWLAVVWLAGAIALLFYYLANALRTQIWLQRRRVALPGESARRIESFFTAHGIRRRPRIWLLERINQPFVWGLVRGSIYLPARLWHGHPGHDFLHGLEARATFQASLLGHELSHVMRFDAMVNSLQVVAQAMFWFHPFVWWANRRIRVEREKCCDEMTIARLNAPPEEYGEAIVETLAAKYEQARPIPSLAVAGQVKNIEERIKTMLRPGKKFYGRPSMIAATVIMLLALCIIPTAIVLSASTETKTATSPLQHAASAGDVEQVKSLLSEGADVNGRDESGRTALHLAALNGHLAVGQALLVNGADVQAKDKEGCTPLALAAREGRVVMVKLLIAKGADVNVKDTRGNTPIHCAAIPKGSYKGLHIRIIRHLIASGADVNARNANGQTAAHVAAGGGRNAHARTVLSLNQLGTDVDAKDKAGNTLLHVAVKNARVWVTDDLVAKGANVNEVNAKGQTPLHIAAGPAWNVDYPNQTAVRATKAQRLILKGANVNALDQNGSTALHEAARHGLTGMAQLLVANHANLKAEDQGGHVPAYLALRALHTKVADMLIDAGGDVPSLYFAAYLGDLPNVKSLVAGGASPDAKDDVGFTPLQAAAAGGRKDVVEYLVSQGADVNAEVEPGWTALGYAAADNHMDVVEFLRSKGASAGKGASELLPIVAGRGHVNAAATLIDLGANANVGVRGRIALKEATFAGHKEMVELLISRGADVNAGPRTSLRITASSGRTDIARCLIAAGADLEAGDWTPLMEAAYYQKDMVKLLIAAGADANAIDSSGWTVLCGAVDEGRLDIAELLLESGARPNVAGENRSALHYAAWYQPDFVELLIAKGADVDARDNNGWTPLHYAGERSMELLLAKGADVNARTNHGETIVHLAAASGNNAKMQFALDKGVDINAKDNLGWTALHRAIVFEHPDTAKLLLAKGADVSVKDNDGKTALAWAQDTGHTEIVDLLKKHGAKE